MNRLTDKDRHLGRFVTYGPSEGWSPLRAVYSSGEDDDSGSATYSPKYNTLTVYAFGWVVRLLLPLLLRPWRRKVHAKYWDAATVAKVGRDWYFEVSPREYGFSLSDGFLQLFFGPQTGDSTTTKSWSTHLPWTQWRHIRRSLYDDKGEHFYTKWSSSQKPSFRASWLAERAVTEACPSSFFEFDDYDKTRVVATCRIEEREWRLGQGWFKWLSLFRKPKVVRSLDLHFDKELGPEKGSWKGGIIGHSIEMRAEETPEQAFRRYCETESTRRGRSRQITYVGVSQPKEPYHGKVHSSPQET
jgi:hypothetical protein